MFYFNFIFPVVIRTALLYIILSSHNMLENVISCLSYTVIISKKLKCSSMRNRYLYNQIYPDKNCTVFHYTGIHFKLKKPFTQIEDTIPALMVILLWMCQHTKSTGMIFKVTKISETSSFLKQALCYCFRKLNTLCVQLKALDTVDSISMLVNTNLTNQLTSSPQK